MIPKLDYSVHGEQVRLYRRWQEKGSPYFLKAFSADRVFGLTINKSSVESDELDSVLLVMLPGWLRKLNSPLPDGWKPWKNTDSKPGFIVLGEKNLDTSGRLGNLLSNCSANWNMVHGCLSFCCEKHGDKCVENNNRTILGFKVIDCETRNIVDASTSYTYLTLSYVWDSDSPNVTIFSRRLPESCPQVIEDAICVVQKLGKRYLRIDRFCINQEDQVEKHAQIANMDIIYARSFLTIVATTDGSTLGGIPGGSTTARIIRSQVNIQD